MNIKSGQIFKLDIEQFYLIDQIVNILFEIDLFEPTTPMTKSNS